MANYVNSVQHGTIVIANGSTSNTATISAVGSGAFIVFLGFSVTAGSGTPDPSSGEVRITLTNSTTVTATRIGTASGATVSFCVVDAASDLVNSVQYGTATISSGNTTGTATVTSVNANQYVIHYLGCSTSDTSASYPTISARLSLSGTTVTATTINATTSDLVVSFVLIEFNAAALDGNIQTFSTSWSNASLSTTQTISSIDTARTLLFHSGWSAGTSRQTGLQKGVLTDATTVTIDVLATGATTNFYNFHAVQFLTGVLTSLQRGSIALTGVASNTATITAVTTANAIIVSGGSNCDTGRYDRSATRVALTNTTTVTANKVSATNNTNIGYAVAEFGTVVVSKAKFYRNLLGVGI